MKFEIVSAYLSVPDFLSKWPCLVSPGRTGSAQITLRMPIDSNQPARHDYTVNHVWSHQQHTSPAESDWLVSFTLSYKAGMIFASSNVRHSNSLFQVK
eukprot:scaffold232497_cov15-Prasinocladus_malaysianus.AAC.1